MTKQKEINDFADQFSDLRFELTLSDKMATATLLRVLANIAAVAATKDEEIAEILQRLYVPQPRDLNNDQWDQFIPPVDPPNPTTNRCSKCDLELKEVMSYYCSIPNCPTGLGGPSAE